MNGIKINLLYINCCNLLLVILLVITFFRLITYSPPYSEGNRVRVSGLVSREPVVYEKVRMVEVEGLRAFLPLYPEVLYGDKVVLEGTVVDGMIEDAVLKGYKQSNNLLYRFRNKILSYYQTNLPEPHSSLVAGVVLGSKASMPTEFWESLKASGTAHVVVASGMNVTLVGGFLLNTLVTYLDRRKAIVGVLVGIWIYALMAGMDAPIIRAAVMGSIAFSAQALGRLNQALRSLFISGALMLILNPVWLRDVGFQLSFVATLSLILFNTKVNRLIQFVPSVVRPDLATSLAAQIGVAPLLFIYFDTINLISPLVNAVVLWTIPLTTIIGMVAGVVGLLIPILGQLLLYIVYPLTWFFVSIVSFF